MKGMVFAGCAYYGTFLTYAMRIHKMSYLFFTRPSARVCANIGLLLRASKYTCSSLVHVFCTSTFWKVQWNATGARRKFCLYPRSLCSSALLIYFYRVLCIPYMYVYHHPFISFCSISYNNTLHYHGDYTETMCSNILGAMYIRIYAAR